jgi:Tol biopolymer transport system component
MKSFVKTSGAVRNGQFSPDGRWVAYASSETGSMEIYVTPFPSAETKWQVSTRGGEEPRWRRDGKELFYVSPDGKMMSVPVKTGDSFEAGSPVMLFQTERRKPVAAQDVFSYDVSAEGKRFLVITRVDEANAQPPSVFLNWASQMQK